MNSKYEDLFYNTYGFGVQLKANPPTSTKALSTWRRCVVPTLQVPWIY